VAHAVVVQVAIETGSDPAHRRGVLDDFVIPEVKSSARLRQGPVAA